MRKQNYRSYLSTEILKLTEQGCLLLTLGFFLFEEVRQNFDPRLGIPLGFLRQLALLAQRGDFLIDEFHVL